MGKGEVHRAFYVLSRQIGLRRRRGRPWPAPARLPSPISAVELLLRWYRNGQDPMVLARILSTDLGHAHVTEHPLGSDGHS